ncbi:MAG: efflux RND transporter periplasmic adaptor subunit [Candidatus Riflebacteria bacterium]|nr:efflux RND transporter periplasmic adaptor subunit [Candidatus Riflebacteria bacterium]
MNAEPVRQPRRLASVLAALLVLLLLALLAIRKGPGEAAAMRRMKVKTHPYHRTLRVMGLLKSSDSFRAHAGLGGVLLKMPKEGSRIKKGELLARFESQEYEDEALEKSLTRDSVRLEREIKKNDLDFEAYEVSNRVKAMEQELLVARKGQELVETGIAAAEYVQLSCQMTASEVLARTLARWLTEMKPYRSRGFVSQEEEEKTATRLGTEKLSGQALSLERSVVASGATPDKRAQAERDVVVAESALKVAQVKHSTFEKRRADGFAEIDTKILGLDEELAYASSQVAKAHVTSPVDGILIYGNAGDEMGRPRKVREGITVHRGVVFAEVVVPGRVELYLEFGQSDGPLVREGMPVEFQVDAYPDLRFAAKLTQVRAAFGGTGLARWLYPEPRRLAAKAKVVDQDERLLPGMTVTADVTVEERPSALWIDTAFLDEDGQVRLADGSSRKVKTGYVKGQEVEVVSGLARDEEIVAPAVARKAPTDQVPVRVARKALSLTLSETGTLAAHKVHDIAPRDLEGDAIIQMMVQEGTSVKKGQVIAQLDKQALESKLKEKKLEFTVAEKERAVVTEQAHVDLNTLKQALEVAALDYRAAQLDAELVHLGKKPRELENLRIDLDSAAAEIALIQKKLSLKDELAKKGYVSDQEIKDLRQNLLTRQVALEVAKVNLQLARRGATTLERQKALATREKSRLNHELARAKLASRKQKRELELAKAELGIRKANLALRRLERMIVECTVTSPAHGTAIRSETWTNDGLRKFQEGDTVRRARTFMRVADLERFKVTAYLPEERVNLIKVGQKASFTLASFPSEAFPGTVELVGRVAQEKPGDRWSWSDLLADRVFDLEIATPVVRPRFQPGLSVSFDVQVGKVPDALVVPIQGLHFDGDGPYVWMASGEQRRIEAREEEKGEVRVTRGLKEGETILVPREDR